MSHKINFLASHLFGKNGVQIKRIQSSLNSRHRANIDGNILTISCTQSSTATLLKHQQSSLLKALHHAGFEQIQKLRVQMALTQRSQPTESDEYLTNNQDLKTKQSAAQQKSSPFAETNSSEANWHKPSASSIKSIEATQSLIKNEQLATSLKASS